MLDLNRGCDTPALLSSGLRWASVWSTCPRSRSRMWRRIWTSSMTVWSSTTPVTVAQRWRIQIASSAHPNPNSGTKTHTHTHTQRDTERENTHRTITTPTHKHTHTNTHTHTHTHTHRHLMHYGKVLRVLHHF